jgi:hypothetical protein
LEEEVLLFGPGTVANGFIFWHDTRDAVSLIWRWFGFDVARCERDIRVPMKKRLIAV